jgi:hypothetical protein
MELRELRLLLLRLRRWLRKTLMGTLTLYGRLPRLSIFFDSFSPSSVVEEIP